MKSLLLKAQAKKNKKKNLIKKIEKEDCSDDDLTSDDEEEVSKNIVGEVFNNKYYCIKYLGRGTFSRVWLVYDIIDNKYFAMKSQFEEFYEDSLHEIKVMKKINNKDNSDSRIVKLYDHFSINKNTYMIYELLGISLLEFFRETSDDDSDANDSDANDSDANDSINEESNDGKRIPKAAVKIIIKDILLGLSEAHNKNIIHTDLKPENILLNIYKPKIKETIDNFTSFNPEKIFIDLITNYLPDDFYEYDRNKRKKHKQKAKVKAINDFKILFKKTDIYQNDTENIDYIDNIDVNTLKAIIVDFGNGEFTNDLVQDEISLRCYRPPENILYEKYDTKADIWVVGCLLYEMLTNEFLFDIDRNLKSIDRNRQHIHQMYELFGKIPLEIVDNCDYGGYYFDNKGRVLKYKDFEHVPILDILVTEFNYNEYEAILINDLLSKMLEYNPNKRLDALECLKYKWLSN